MPKIQDYPYYWIDASQVKLSCFGFPNFKTAFELKKEQERGVNMAMKEFKQPNTAQQAAPQAQSEKKKPYASFRDGVLELTCWKNATPEGKEFFTFTISRGYKDEDGEWHNTQNLNRSDLPIMQDLFLKAWLETSGI